MENPFEILDQRLSVIEEKLETLIQKPANNKIPSVVEPTWVTNKQLAQHLGVSTAMITNIRGTKIPFYKIGGRILFKREEVDEYIEKSRHMSDKENLDNYLNRYR
jgi:excisionase family DNA binding protein